MSFYLGADVDYSQGLPTPVAGLGQDAADKSLIPAAVTEIESKLMSDADFRRFALANLGVVAFDFGSLFIPGLSGRVGAGAFGAINGFAAYNGLKSAFNSNGHPVGRVAGGAIGVLNALTAFFALSYAVKGAGTPAVTFARLSGKRRK